MSRQFISKAQKATDSSILAPNNLSQRIGIDRTDYSASIPDTANSSGLRNDKSSFSGMETHFNHDFCNIPITLQGEGGSIEDALAGADVPPEVAAANALKKGMLGTPLMLPHREKAETVLRRSLDKVQAYTGFEAREACECLGVRAFTVRNVIIFAETNPSLELVVHEATHVVQQKGDEQKLGVVPDKIPLASSTETSEQEAYRIARDAGTADVKRKPEVAPVTVHGEDRLNGFIWLSGCNNSNSGITLGQKSVKDTDSQGWLKVKVGNTEQSVPWYLKINHTARASGRDQFKVQEGPYKNKNCSVSAKSSSASYLGTGLSYKGAATLKFNKTTKKIKYGSSGWFSAKTDPRNPLPDGTHVIEMPDAPHSLGCGYLNESSYATTWFRLGTSGDRYLHPGRVSKGCATVTEVSEWTDLYKYLINSRKNDTQVGSITVES